MYYLKHICILLLSLLTINTFGQTIHRKGRKLEVGSSEYSLQKYNGGEYNWKTVYKMRVLKPFFRNFFLKNTDSTFLKSLDTTAQYHLIEPLIVNLSNSDGLYCCRDYSKKDHRSIHWSNGYPHYIFLVSNSHVYYFYKYNNDTIAIMKTLNDETPHLFTLFREKDIDIMKDLAKATVYWSDMIEETPFRLYKGKKVYFTSLKEIDSPID